MPPASGSCRDWGPVSIITPAYNCAPVISDTIRSVQNQTYGNWELIVVDDASTDRTADIVADFADHDDRITLVRGKVNSGAAQSRNQGLERARNRRVAFLDSDDQWHPEKLAKQLAFMVPGGHAITFTSYLLVNQEGKSLDKIIRVVPTVTRHDYLKNTIIGCSTAIVDRELTGEFRFLDIRTRQDTHLWISLLGRGVVAKGLDEVLAKYRVHRESLSADKVMAAKQVWHLYRHIVGLKLVPAVYYFGFYVFNAVKKRL